MRLKPDDAIELTLMIANIIRSGNCEGKVALVDAASRVYKERGKHVSLRDTSRILEWYTEVLWTFDVGERGVRVYRMIVPWTAVSIAEALKSKQYIPRGVQ